MLPGSHEKEIIGRLKVKPFAAFAVRLRTANHYSYDIKIIHVFSNLSCRNRYLTPPGRYLIYHSEPIILAPRSISSNVSRINQERHETSRGICPVLGIKSLYRFYRSTLVAQCATVQLHHGYHFLFPVPHH